MLGLLLFLTGISMAQAQSQAQGQAQAQAWPLDLAKVMGPVVIPQKQMACHLRELSDTELAKMKAGEAAKLIDLTIPGCAAGEKVFLYSYEPKHQRRSLRAIGERVSGREIKILTAVLPARTIEAPWCPSCDEFWMGAVPLESEKFDHAFYIQDDQRILVSKEFSHFKKLGLTYHPVAGQLPGRKFDENVLLADVMPTGLRTEEVARFLKSRGAKRVVWLWAGLRSYFQPYVADLPTGVKRLQRDEFEQKAKSGALVIDAVGTKPQRRRIFPWVVDEADFLSQVKTADRSRQILVFDMGPYGRSGLNLMFELKQLGFENVSFYSGGLREWSER